MLSGTCDLLCKAPGDGEELVEPVEAVVLDLDLKVARGCRGKIHDLIAVVPTHGVQGLGWTRHDEVVKRRCAALKRFSQYIPSVNVIDWFIVPE